jgi:hypothetical protein
MSALCMDVTRRTGRWGGCLGGRTLEIRVRGCRNGDQTRWMQLAEERVELRSFVLAGLNLSVVLTHPVT